MTDDWWPANAAKLDEIFRSTEYAHLLGSVLKEWEPGHATVRWTPERQHRNFLGGIHGGALFSVADEALGVACNSWGRVCVALTVEAHYLAPPLEGGPLIAVASERSRTRRTGSYLLTVYAEDRPDELMASFHAMTYRTDQWLLGPDAWPQAWRDEH